MIAIIVLWILLGIIALVVILLHFSIVAHVNINGDGFEVEAKYLGFTIYPRKEKPYKVKNSRKRRIKKRKEKDIFTDDFEDDFDDLNEYEVTPKIKDNDTQEMEISPDIAGVEIEESHDKFGMDGLEESFSEPVAIKKIVEGKSEKVEKKKKLKKKKSKKSKKIKAENSEKPKGRLAGLREKYVEYKPYIPMGWKYFKKLLKTIRFTDLKTDINVGRHDAHEAAIYYGAVQGILFNTLGMLANIFTVSIKRANVNCVFTKNTISGEFECDVKVRPSTVIAIAVCMVVKYLLIKHKLKREDSHEEVESQKIKKEVVNS